MAYSTLPAKVAGDVFTEAMWTNIKDNFTAMRADGTAAAPAVTFDSDTDTGLYNAGANRLGFTTAGTKALEIAADGKVLFGNATDTNLYRDLADRLKTDDSFEVGGRLRVSDSIYQYNASSTAYTTQNYVTGDTQSIFAVRHDGLLWWGAGGSSVRDTNLYRSAANVLKTDDALKSSRSTSSSSAFVAEVDADSNPRFTVRADGQIQWGSGSAAADVTLYRESADVLITDDALVSTRATSSSIAFASAVDLDTFRRFSVVADGKHEWGSGSAARDTNLYRSAADTLKTDDSLIVAGDLTVSGAVTGVGGAWTAYTPTWAGTGGTPSLGTGGTLSGRYLQIGKTVFFCVNFGFGSDTNANSATSWTFSLPSGLTARSTGGLTQTFVARLQDSGGNYYSSVARVLANGTTFQLFIDGNTTAVGYNNPFTWANTDGFQMSGFYEIA